MSGAIALSGIVLTILAVAALRRSLEVRISREGFEHWVHSLAKAKQDGGTVSFSPLDVRQAIVRVERGPGTGSRCEILVDVPRTSWSEQRSESIRDALVRDGLEPFEPADRLDVLLRIGLPIPDIWDEASGARGSRVVRRIFEAAGIEPAAWFRVSMAGQNSARIWKRWQDSSNPIIRGMARRARRQIEAEEAKERDKASRRV